MNPQVHRALREELGQLLKQGSSHMSVSQVREGRRPMRVATMLKKDEAGTLWKGKKKEASAPAGVLGRVAQHLHKHEDAYELGGLGILGAIGADRLQAHARAGAGADDHAIEKKQVMGESGHAALDTAGLGILAAPVAAHMFLHKK